MMNNELNIVTIAGPDSDSVLDEIKSSIAHNIDEFGVYFTIANKYYTAKIHFNTIKSYKASELLNSAQALVIVSDELNAINSINEFKSLLMMKFLWLIESKTPQLIQEIEDICLDNGIEMIISKKSEEKPREQYILNTFQVPLLELELDESSPFSLFRSLECHKWNNSIEHLKDDMSLDYAIEVVKEARSMNSESDNVNERISRATKAIMEIKSLL